MRREAQIVFTGSRVTLDAKGREKLRALLNGPVDWAALLALAIPHGVLPLMFRNLSAAASDLTPASLLSQLGKHAARVQARNERALSELGEIIERLEHARIDVVPFKGPVMQRTLYNGPLLREFTDLDLMVRRDQFVAAGEVMQSDGYRLSDRIGRHGLHGLLRTGCVAEFIREGCITVEVHWAFSPVGFDFPLDPATLQSELEFVEIAGRPAKTYGPQAMVLILCAHHAKHQWRRLNWLCDVAALLANRGELIQWHNVLKHARILRCERIVITTLCLAESLLGVELPDQVRDRLREDMSPRRLADAIAPTILEGFRQRRWLFVQMREGGRLAACGRYFASKVRRYFILANVEFARAIQPAPQRDAISTLRS